jgi:hypothetical protein
VSVTCTKSKCGDALYPRSTVFWDSIDNCLIYIVARPQSFKDLLGEEFSMTQPQRTRRQSDHGHFRRNDEVIGVPRVFQVMPGLPS